MSLLLRRMFDPRSNIAAMTEAVSTLARYKELVLEMTRRELLDRYAGTALGGVWAFGAPLLLLAANVFAFMYVMRLRLGAGYFPPIPASSSRFLCSLASLLGWLCRMLSAAPPLPW